MYLRFLFTRALTLASTRRTSSRQHLLKERNNAGNMKTGAGWLKILRSDVFVTFKVTNSTFKIGPGLRTTHWRAKIMCGLWLNQHNKGSPLVCYEPVGCLSWCNDIMLIISPLRHATIYISIIIMQKKKINHRVLSFLQKNFGKNLWCSLPWNRSPHLSKLRRSSYIEIIFQHGI